MRGFGRRVFRQTGESQAHRARLPDHMLRRGRAAVEAWFAEQLHCIYVLAVRHAAMDFPRRIAELEPQLVHEAEAMARRVEGSSGPESDRC